MSVRATQDWFRRVAFAGAVLATAVLTLGATPQPAAAQYYPGYGNGYGYGYGYPAAYGYGYPAVYPYYPYYGPSIWIGGRFYGRGYRRW